MQTAVIEHLSGWGRCPVEPCRVLRINNRAAAAAAWTSGAAPHYIARGLGRSYGDTALNLGAGVLDMTGMNRLLGFDPATGVLECEAGVSLETILDVFVPRGYFLPVTPGTKYVTVGGAIANDVHGKNHHRDGAFGNFVESLTLLTPTGEVIDCSPQRRPGVFWATVGGIGLTGVILTARLRLQPVETAYIRLDRRRARCLDAALAAMADNDAKYQYSVAWVDCLAKGRHLGRSVLMWGNHAERGDLPARLRDPERALRWKRPANKPVLFDFPGFVLNPWSIKVFNTLFYAKNTPQHEAIVNYDAFFYPLDGLDQWNRMYGRNGFVQFQASLPFESLDTLVRLLEGLSRSSRASFLAVLKRFGPAGQGLLSHPIEGYTLTLDLPFRGGLVPFLRDMAALVLEGGGRLYTAKDAHASAHVFEAMYPKLDAFRAIQQQLDPEGRLSSSMARRLGMVRR